MATPGALRVVEWNVAHVRSMWRATLLNSFLQPLLYLLGLGIGVGTLVNRNSSSIDALGGVTYARFVGPGLLTTTAMAIAYFESAWPILGGFTWERHYLAMASTPLRAVDITLGHLLWLSLRVLTATIAVASALMLFPSVRSLGLLTAIPFATLSGVAFGTAVVAFSSYQTRDVAFVSVQRFVVVPLFLFGGAFFPLGQLPGWLQAIIRVAPLWHGTELCRGLVRHTLGFTEALGHVGYLAVWIAIGMTVATRKFVKRLGA